MPVASPLDLSRLRVLPLAERRSLTRAEDILVPLDRLLPEVSPLTLKSVAEAAQRIRAARDGTQFTTP